MTEKDVFLILIFLSAVLAGWVIYLLHKVQDLKEDIRVTKAMSDYYKDKVIKYEAKILGIKAELKDVG